MLAGLEPVLLEVRYSFCTTGDPTVLAALVDRCLALFREVEGTAFVLTEQDAGEFGLDLSTLMSRIVL